MARFYINSGTRGTQRTIYCNGTVTITYTDFEDIKGAGSASWDLSTAARFTGDCGGNTGITFTTAGTEYLRGSGNRSFSTAGNWANAVDGAAGSGRVPLPQDTAYIDSTTGTGYITMDLARTGSWVFSYAAQRFYTTQVYTIYGSATLSGGFAFWTGSGTQYRATFAGRAANTITCGGATWPAGVTIDCPGYSVTLADTAAVNITIVLTAGTLNDGNNNVTTNGLSVTGTTTRTLTLGSGTWTITRSFTSSGSFNFTDTTNLTFNKGTGLVRFLYNVEAGRSYHFGGLTFNNVQMSTGTNAITLLGGATFNTFTVDAGCSVRFYRGLTWTAATWAITGTAGSGITLASDTTSAATIAKSGGGTVVIQYATISYLTGSPTNTFYAYSSTDGGNNTAIYFTKTLTGTTDLDAILRVFVTRYGSTALDAVLRAYSTYTGTALLDVLLAATRTGSTYLDVILGTSRTGLFYLDTYLEKPFSGPVGAYDKILAYRTLYISGSGLSGTDGRFRFVKCGAKKDTVVLAAPGDVPLGVNYGIGLNKTKIQVPCAGIVKLRLAGKVKRGNMLKVCSDLNDGRAVASTNTRAYGAMALQNGESGEIISALLLQGHGS